MSKRSPGQPGRGSPKRAKPDISGHPENGLVEEDGITVRQRRGLEALLAEPTITRAAEVAGVDERTMRRWMDAPPFRAALNAGWRQSYGHAVGLTQKLAPAAVAALARVMQDPGGGPGAKVSAATALLRFGREGIELDDLAARVAALEQAAAAAPPPPPQAELENGQ